MFFAAPLVLALAARPLPPNLLPSTLRWAPPTSMVLHVDEPNPVPEKKHFRDGRLVAGILGGLYTAATIAPRVAVGCPDRSPPGRGAIGALTAAALSIGLGTGLGLLAGNEIPGTYGMLIAFDVIAPIGTTVYSLAVC